MNIVDSLWVKNSNIGATGLVSGLMVKLGKGVFVSD